MQAVRMPKRVYVGQVNPLTGDGRICVTTKRERHRWENQGYDLREYVVAAPKKCKSRSRYA